MNKTAVEQWLNDLSLADPTRHALVQSVREAVYAVIPTAAERVMYGGIMISAPAMFCGVFAYTSHVSVEFGRGCDLEDPHGVLEGKGKMRRHIKLQSPDDIATRHLSEYILQAWTRSMHA
jgi:hypothetical protein